MLPPMAVEEEFKRQLHGAVVTELIRLEYWFEGELESEVNVLFARVKDDRWIRFFFDAGVFFWREVAIPDVPETQGPYSWRLLPAHLPGLRLSSTVDEVAFIGDEGQMPRSLAVSLSNGSGFTLQNIDDQNVLGPLLRSAHRSGGDVRGGRE